MVINYLHKIGWFIGLVLLQVLILNNVHIAGYATPFLYIYLILKFESETPRNTLMLWAFFLGLLAALLIVWLIFLGLTLLYSTSVGHTCFGMIEKSVFLKFLYDHNPFLIRLLAF